jgi:hypothetical protein
MSTIEKVLSEFKQSYQGKIPKKPGRSKKFNVYYWHRRYGTHKFLDKKANIWDKLNNGDFEYSPYAKQINNEYHWMAEEIVAVRNTNKDISSKFEIERDVIRNYNKRLKNLWNDFNRDEHERLESLQFSLRLEFGGSKENVREYIFEIAEGSIEEIINGYPKWLKEDDSPF